MLPIQVLIPGSATGDLNWENNGCIPGRKMKGEDHEAV